MWQIPDIGPFFLYQAKFMRKTFVTALKPVGSNPYAVIEGYWL